MILLSWFFLIFGKIFYILLESNIFKLNIGLRKFYFLIKKQIFLTYYFFVIFGPAM